MRCTLHATIAVGIALVVGFLGSQALARSSGDYAAKVKEATPDLLRLVDGSNATGAARIVIEATSTPRRVQTTALPAKRSDKARSGENGNQTSPAPFSARQVIPSPIRTEEHFKES